MRVFNKTIASNISLNASYNSPYVPMKQMYTYTVSAQITGTPTGIIQLQASNDPETNDSQTNTMSNTAPSVAPTNWVTIKNSPFVVTTEGECMWNVFYAGYNYIRVQYIDNSGGTSMATMVIIFNGKG